MNHNQAKVTQRKAKATEIATTERNADLSNSMSDSTINPSSGYSTKSNGNDIAGKHHESLQRLADKGSSAP